MNLKEIIEEFDLEAFNENATNFRPETLLLNKGLLHRGFAASMLKGLDGEQFDRKLLYSWKKKGLLPFEIPSGWGRFNMVELVWLRLLIELRAFGVGLKSLMDLKRYYFETEEYAQVLYQNIVERFKRNELNESFKLVLLNEDDSVISFEDFTRNYTSKEDNRLLHHIVGVILNRHNLCLRLTLDGGFDFLELGEFQKAMIDADLVKKTDWYQKLIHQSCIIVNLTNIIREITQTHDLFTIEENKISFKRSAESLIRELFNEDNITEITIRLTNKDEPLLMVKRELSYRDLHQKINSLQRRGVFSNLIIKTRDGKVSYFESVDFIKL